MFNCVPKMLLLPVKKKRKKISYLILYDVLILYNFINCPVFIGIKK